MSVNTLKKAKRDVDFMDREVGKILEEYREEEPQSKYILWKKKNFYEKRNNL